ncbi:MAG: sodium-dependent dicarboxylate transporter 2/3/5 [Myxococcota bacterium]|jgi:sodium-dependent dicarboxylate transporter 2/3/5
MSSGDRTRGGNEAELDKGPGDLEIPVEEILNNPGLLKLELIMHGLRLAPGLSTEVLGGSGPSPFATTFELDVHLPEGTAATVPINQKLTAKSPYVLEQNEGGHVIVTEGGSVEVTVNPPPAFYQLKTPSGIPFGRFATMHGGYLALSPVAECQFLSNADRCRFCSLDGSFPGEGSRVPVEDVIEAVRAAQAERPIQMIYLSVGYIEGPGSGVRVLEPYVRAIKKSFNVLVAIDALPPADNAWIDNTYAMGVDSVSYNLEIFGPEEFKRMCPGPARTIGRQRFLDALSYAATVFNDGAVISHLIVGIEPIENTLVGIDELVRRRVVPVLPVFRPFKGIDLRHERSPKIGTRQLSSVYAHLYNQLRSNKIPMGWVRDISVVTTPMEGRFFVGGESGLSRFLSRVWGDPHRKPSPRLVDLRRTLRVREMEPDDPE